MTTTLSQFGQADSLITIDLDAITHNWRILDSLSGSGTETAAVVKADGYGLGATVIAPALAQAGCRTFFVMSLAEAAALRAALDDAGQPDRRILALGGCHAGQEADFDSHCITPVVNTLEQYQRLATRGRAAERPMAAALHIDTGMTRLGLDRDELAWLQAALETGANEIDGVAPCLLMSHLSASEDLNDVASARQLADFMMLRRPLPDMPASLANSGGCFLGASYQFDLTRPGIALYGLHPAGADMTGLQTSQSASLRQAVIWQGRILQHRRAAAGDAVGYNGTHMLSRDSRIATIGVGYADGYPRSLGNVASVEIGGKMAPVVGRVSMDSITVDVTDIDEAVVDGAGHATLLGESYPLAEMARDAGTIGYEILTQLGRRPARRFKGGQKRQSEA
ncbi:MAG: alanine racemase [Candidatus Puniceispirillaceae bacterium]